MTRVSPPELERACPGPQASISVTCAPRRSSSSAVHPPNAPAPTTTMRGELAEGRMDGTQPPSLAESDSGAELHGETERGLTKTGCVQVGSNRARVGERLSQRAEP